jgi:hypothetical protein
MPFRRAFFPFCACPRRSGEFTAIHGIFPMESATGTRRAKPALGTFPSSTSRKQMPTPVPLPSSKRSSQPEAEDGDNDRRAVPVARPSYFLKSAHPLSARAVIRPNYGKIFLAAWVPEGNVAARFRFRREQPISRRNRNGGRVKISRRGEIHPFLSARGLITASAVGARSDLVWGGRRDNNFALVRAREAAEIKI